MRSLLIPARTGITAIAAQSTNFAAAPWGPPVRSDAARSGWRGYHSAATSRWSTLPRVRTISTVCVLAPYLGNRLLTAEIARSPAPAAWAAGDIGDADEERRVWRFIHAQHGGRPHLYLGYGREERFAAAHRLMAQAMEPDAVDVVPRGHDWRTWTALWENFLTSRFS